MPLYRAYVDLKKGNEHSRVIDLRAADEADARTAFAAELKKTEVIGQIVTLKDTPQASEG